MGGRQRTKVAAQVCTAMTAAALFVAMGTGAATGSQSRVTVLEYDSFGKPGGYTIVDYLARWSNPYGIGEMALEDTRRFDNDTFFVGATPFRTSADFSVFDHIKYFARSTADFPVPARGSVSFGATIEAETPGTQPEGRQVTGTYAPWVTHPTGKDYTARAMEGQQAGATLHMIDFSTGQLFDWFVSSNTAMTLIERLPSSVTGSSEHVGRDKMYTQIIREIPLAPGPHRVEIRYTRTGQGSSVEYLLDDEVVSKVDQVGVPLDVQGAAYTGTYPSLGQGELLHGKINAVTIGHGLFSLIDAFPFQHPEAPEAIVSIPRDERLFGQGARAHFDDVVVRTVETGPK